MDYNLLEQSFDQIFGSWNALQFAVDQRCMGLKTREIVNGMASCFRTYFTENDDLQMDEVADALVDWISDDLHVNIEDGSDSEVASQMCQVYAYLSAGNKDAVQELLQKLPSYDASLFTVDEGNTVNGIADGPGSGESDSEEGGSSSNNEGAMEEDGSESVQRQPRYTTDEDGWTTKNKRNKKPE